MKKKKKKKKKNRPPREHRPNTHTYIYTHPEREREREKGAALKKKNAGSSSRAESVEGRQQCAYEYHASTGLFDYDKLKSVSRGYTSMDLLTGYRADSLVKVDILVNGDPLDALSIIIHREVPIHAGAPPSSRSSSRSL